MVVVLWVVGLVVHMGSGVVHVLPYTTVLVVVLPAHLLMMTPFLQTGLVVVLWVLVASLMEGSQPVRRILIELRSQRVLLVSAVPTHGGPRMSVP